MTLPYLSAYLRTLAEDYERHLLMLHQRHSLSETSLHAQVVMALKAAAEQLEQATADERKTP